MSSSTALNAVHSQGPPGDPTGARALFEPLRDALLQRWQEEQAPYAASTQAAFTPGELQGLFEGLLNGRLPEEVLDAWVARAAAAGVEAAVRIAMLVSLVDAALDLLIALPGEPDDLRLAARLLGAIRAAAIALAANSPLLPGAEPAPATGGRVELPAHLLRRILSLSTSVGPETSMDGFAQRLAQAACEMGGFPFCVLFFFDAIDEAFYAEAMYGLHQDDWQEVLAVAVPRRVYGRLTTGLPDADGILELHEGDALLDDPEIETCIAPLLHCTTERHPQVEAADQGRGPAAHDGLAFFGLEIPGRGTIGFCAAGLPAGLRRLREPVRRALSALASQGAISVENIYLYRSQLEEAAVSSALLQVAGAVGTTDVDRLVQRTLGILPRLFGGQSAGLLYLDRRRGELRMLEPKAPDGQLTALTEVKVTPAKLEQLEPVVRAREPVAIEEPEIGRLLPVGLVQARGLRSALIMPLDLSHRAADALAVFWTAAPHRFRSRDLEVARGVSELVGVALANAQLFTDASNRAEELSSLYRTGQMIGSSLDLDEVLRTMAAAAVQLTRSRLCMIYLIDPKSGLLDYVAGAGLEASTDAPSPLRPGEGLLGRCALLGKPLVVDDLWPDPDQPPLEPAIAGDVRAALFLPLIASGEVIGVLGIAAEMPGYFQSEHQQILQAFANQAAVAIERGRLYAAEQRRREIAELQQTMTQALGSTLELRDVLGQVLAFAHVLVGYDLASIHVLDGGALDLAVRRDRAGLFSDEPVHGPYLLAEPLYAQMRDSGSATVVTETGREPLWRPIAALPQAASWIGAPLLLDGEYMVVLDLYNLKPGAYTQEDADTIGQFAQQVAFAVRNARIYAREREAKMRLEELDQLRADFVSTVSHELRTPLTGIKGFTETLLTYWQRLPDDKRHHYLDKIYSSSKRLQRLVQDLLFVSKVEGGNLPLTIRKVQFQDLIESAVMEIKQKYRGQTVDVDLPEPLPEVLADGDRAQQVLVNLMDNGVKYSPEGSPITVRCTLEPQAVRVSVIDHGPGIRQQDMPRLFTRFGKIDQVIRAGHVGTGLGLFISKQLVEQMRGEITVRSVLGDGSTFSFTLPRADR